MDGTPIHGVLLSVRVLSAAEASGPCFHSLARSSQPSPSSDTGGCVPQNSQTPSHRISSPRHPPVTLLKTSPFTRWEKLPRPWVVGCGEPSALLHSSHPPPSPLQFPPPQELRAPGPQSSQPGVVRCSCELLRPGTLPPAWLTPSPTPMPPCDPLHASASCFLPLPTRRGLWPHPPFIISLAPGPPRVLGRVALRAGLGRWTGQSSPIRFLSASRRVPGFQRWRVCVSRLGEGLATGVSPGPTL